MKKVLIAEDDRFLASAYKLAFEGEKFQVDLAFDGQEAIDKIPSFQPDCIILDLKMPKLDGFGVLEEMKKHNIKIPVIIATNLGQESDIVRGKALGAVAYIIKSETPITEVIKKAREVSNHS